AGRTCLDARRLQSDFHAIDAERALRHLSGLFAELRNFKWTARGAVAAADALGLIDIDDAIRVLHDRARRRTCLQAAGLRAVHALIFAHQPHQAAFHFAFVEADEVPELRVELRKGLIRSCLLRRDSLEVVPFLTRRLARLAANARRRIDVLGDDRLL